MLYLFLLLQSLFFLFVSSLSPSTSAAQISETRANKKVQKIWQEIFLPFTFKAFVSHEKLASIAVFNQEM